MTAAEHKTARQAASRAQRQHKARRA
jgi:hypothetical protein